MNEKKDYYLKILITECVLVAIVLLSTVTLKLCFKSEYKKLKELFKEQYYSVTTITEVLEDLI